MCGPEKARASGVNGSRTLTQDFQARTYAGTRVRSRAFCEDGRHAGMGRSVDARGQARPDMVAFHTMQNRAIERNHWLPELASCSRCAERCSFWEFCSPDRG